MKAVGFVTKIMHDETTGRELAVVYVPTSPNPTSGYIEIVPLSDVVQTDWTIEEAMSFVMTGGNQRARTHPVQSRAGRYERAELAAGGLH
ncbi:MAG: DUF502 domain-containing protein [Burkholderiales bacterium]|nr:DUF502 domain-containing protein [Burkholderiales bacterium]